MGAWGRGESKMRGVDNDRGPSFLSSKTYKGDKLQYRLQGARPRRNKRLKRHVKKQKREELSLFPWHQ
jgi:hypothetical protein